MRLPIVAAIALTALAVGGVIGWQIHVPKLNALLYATNRLIVVQVHLDEAPPDYILVAGDSQAELQSTSQRICGLELVNAGVNGASAAIYADLLDRVTVPTRPRAAVLTIGTNDLFTKSDPRSAEGIARFEQSLARIVGKLRGVTDRVVVTAVPPFNRKAATKLDAEAVGVYSARIRAFCERSGCAYADPFADLRDGDSGYAVAGALRDDLHIAGYRRVMRALEPALCPASAP
ncbi:SGNH/GDSL hydrolase family protein [Methylobacterium sp. 77]|uniref:SGNH/GDSL hydrolase family protein n=1 Tax=Methylobacterium sp. 77 TaxID=1101192 RepID=UPI000376F1C8|nr:SGNH/GDSL hydrolase family protein [Methylobacterium sp. 77]